VKLHEKLSPIGAKLGQLLMFFPTLKLSFNSSVWSYDLSEEKISLLHAVGPVIDNGLNGSFILVILRVCKVAQWDVFSPFDQEPSESNGFVSGLDFF